MNKFEEFIINHFGSIMCVILFGTVALLFCIPYATAQDQPLASGESLTVTVPPAQQAEVGSPKTIVTTLTWSNPPGLAAGTKIAIKRSNDNGLNWGEACSVLAPATTCIDTALPVGFTYQWKGVLSNQFGDGPMSQPAIVAAMPPVTTILNLAVGNLQMNQ